MKERVRLIAPAAPMPPKITIPARVPAPPIRSIAERLLAA